MRRYGGEGGKDFGGYASGGEHVRLGEVLSGCSGYGSYLWRGRCLFLFASRQRGGISDPQSGTGSFGDWLGADDFLRDRRGCVLGIPAGKGISSREPARRFLGRTVFPHVRPGWPRV